MNTFGKLVASLSGALEFNQATLSGCVDIIVVQQQDGSLKSTPFHARFGKLKILKSKDRTVKIHVNGQEAGFVMKLGEAGEAFFEEEIIKSDDKSCKRMAEDPLIIPEAITAQIKFINENGNEGKQPKTLLDMLQLKQSAKTQSTSAQTKTNSDHTNDCQMEIEHCLDAKFMGHNYMETLDLPNIERPRAATSQSKASDRSQLLNSSNIYKSEGSQGKKVKVKTLRPSSQDIESLNLRLGVNTITYTVHSVLQGSQTISGHIYFWPQDANIIISDIDGTITKTDVMGHIMGMFGKDWSQPGIAPLYTNIRRNGYYILYLTSRPIGQAHQTKEFLHSIYQDGSMLPHGPLLLSPDRVLPSVKREVIFKRPELFKMAALKDIRSLFPDDHNPFHAGFGNRETDAIAYKSVGIPLEKVFIVNSKGDIHHHDNSTAKSYAIINTMIKDIFPGIVKNEKCKLAESLNPSNILLIDDKNKLVVNTSKAVC